MRYLFLLCCLAIVAITACSKNRFLSSEQMPTLPPVTHTGIAKVPADEPPLIRTDKGFVPTTIPGVAPSPAPTHEYIIYTGPSN